MVVNKIKLVLCPNRAYSFMGLGNEIPSKNPYDSIMVTRGKKC